MSKSNLFLCCIDFERTSCSKWLSSVQCPQCWWNFSAGVCDFTAQTISFSFPLTEHSQRMMVVICPFCTRGGPVGVGRHCDGEASLWLVFLWIWSRTFTMGSLMEILIADKCNTSYRGEVGWKRLPKLCTTLFQISSSHVAMTSISSLPVVFNIFFSKSSSCHNNKSSFPFIHPWRIFCTLRVKWFCKSHSPEHNTNKMRKTFSFSPGVIGRGIPEICLYASFFRTVTVFKYKYCHYLGLMNNFPVHGQDQFDWEREAAAWQSSVLKFNCKTIVKSVNKLWWLEKVCWESLK